MTQDDLNRVLAIQANVNAADAAALQALIDAAEGPVVTPDQPGLYAVIDPATNRVVQYIRGDSPAAIIDQNRQYATYIFRLIVAEEMVVMPRAKRARR